VRHETAAFLLLLRLGRCQVDLPGLQLMPALVNVLFTLGYFCLRPTIGKGPRGVSQKLGNEVSDYSTRSTQWVRNSFTIGNAGCGEPHPGKEVSLPRLPLTRQVRMGSSRLGRKSRYKRWLRDTIARTWRPGTGALTGPGLMYHCPLLTGIREEQEREASSSERQRGSL
jgi:hypothetical protein